MQLRLIRLTATTAMLCLSSMVLIGCGGGSDGYEGDTGTVSGVVKLNGKPITEKVIVTFLSKEGFSASGLSDSSGKYTLQYKQSPNIPIGKYSVSINSGAGAIADTRSPEEVMNAAMDADGKAKDAPEVKSEIPDKVKSPGGSGITKDVVAGENPIDIEI